MSKSMDLETLPVLIKPLSPPSSSSPPPAVQAASIRPHNMTPMAYKEHKNKMNRRSCEKKMLEREDDKERIRSLEKSLCLEKKKSKALEIKVQELEGKLEGKL